DASANTAVHADSRQLAFDSSGTSLFETDDGGINRLTNPNGVTGGGTREWVETEIGNIRCTELFSIAYDSVNHVFFGGAQDNGVPEQVYQDIYTAVAYLGGDGGEVGVDNTSLPGHSLHYATSTADNQIHRRDANAPFSEPSLPLVVNGT